MDRFCAGEITWGKLSRLKKAQLMEIVQHYKIDEVEGDFR